MSPAPSLPERNQGFSQADIHRGLRARLWAPRCLQCTGSIPDLDRFDNGTFVSYLAESCTWNNLVAAVKWESLTHKHLIDIKVTAEEMAPLHQVYDRDEGVRPVALDRIPIRG